MRIERTINDHVELSYAIEEIIMEAQEEGMDDEEIVDVLESYAKAKKHDRYPFI